MCEDAKIKESSKIYYLLYYNSTSNYSFPFLCIRTARISCWIKLVLEILKTDIVTASEEFTSNEDMFAYLKKWADDNKLNYEVDDSNNIIFTSDAISGKEDVSPTIVATSYDYLTTETDASSLSTAAAVANSNIDAGKYTVIFFNNDANSGIGYKNINSKNFPDDAKVIYLDYGDKGYSFGQVVCEMQLAPSKFLLYSKCNFRYYN